jgi:hypothetical protein
MKRLMFVTFVCAVATAASAQTPAAPPAAQPTAGQSHREPPQTMMLTLGFSGAGAGDSEGLAPEAAALTGVHTDTDALLAYQRHFRKATLGFSGRTVVRYDARSEDLTPMREQGTIGFSTGGTNRQIRASQSVGFSPYYQFGAMPNGSPSELDETALAHGDFANSGVSALTLSTDATMTQAIGRRTSLALSYYSQRTTFDQSNLDQMSLIGSVSLSHRLSRYLSLRTGYGLRSARYPSANAETVRVHALDLGLDYARALSLTRRTTLSFRSGSVATKVADGMAYVITGDAALTRMIGRTWNVRLGVKRDVNLLEGFTEPVLSNVLTTGIGGGLNRRMSVSSSVTVSSGTVGVANQTGSNYWNWTAGGAWRLTLSRRSALDAGYFYYGHRFEDGVVLPPGVLNQQIRQGLRVGLTWLIPVMQ